MVHIFIFYIHIIKAPRKWCINKLIIYLERFQIKMIFKIAVWDIHVDVHTCITCLLCNQNLVEDECHFVTDCPFNGYIKKKEIHFSIMSQYLTKILYF